MISKEEYYQNTLKTRQVLADPKVIRCTCPDTLCELHGKCKECVAIHRYENNHIPACLQPIIRDKAKAILAVVEMEATKKEGTPVEYRRYVQERDQQEK